MMCCEPDEPMTTHCLQAIHRCVPKFSIVFHQNTSPINKICNIIKEMMRTSSLSVDKILNYRILIEKINIGVNNNEKCFWTPFCFFQKRHNNILW